MDLPTLESLKWLMVQTPRIKRLTSKPFLQHQLTNFGQIPRRMCHLPYKANMEIRFGHGIVSNFNPVNGLKIVNM